MSINDWNIPKELKDALLKSKSCVFPKSREDLIKLATGNGLNQFEVFSETSQGKKFKEADVTLCKNGVAVNYQEPYMRRRDPNCTFVGDEFESDKPRFKDVFKMDFPDFRKDTIKWFSETDVIVMPFITGRDPVKIQSLFVGPLNCAFFAMAVADLQNLMNEADLNREFSPKIIIYLAPVFRHTHFSGKQVVVHNRTENLYEIFSYNLYPGPSAKKGIYGALLSIGEKEGWLTLHASSTKLITPYDNSITILHEGASGGGKSEMNEYMEHTENSKMRIAENIIDGKVIETSLINECEIHPVTDDMSICHTSIQKNDGKLHVMDAENAWFVRVNHIEHYGMNPHFEKMCIHPSKPMIFLNIQAVAGSTCLIWEHIEDAPSKRCPNPRVIFPRELIPNIENSETAIDYRSFGIRTPPCTSKNPSYGIIGFFHILPPALAWLWRLVAPRGHDNPSIISSEGMSSEGIGTYGPFLTGSPVKHANMLLEQFIKNNNTCNVLFPNQYVGAWKTGFMPQWFVREYLARRGGRKFEESELKKAGTPLLGYIRKELKVEGISIPDFLIDVSLQPEVGKEAFQFGEKMLYEFFDKELKKFKTPQLSKKGMEIIECFESKGSVEDYSGILN